MKTYELWARVGVTVNVPENEIEEFNKNQEAYVKKSLTNGSARVNGETYFPEDVKENEEFVNKYGSLGW